MTATYTFDVFSTLDGFGSYDEPGDWGGYWGKQGPELLDRRLALYDEPQRMVFGATTFGQFVQMLAVATDGDDSGVRDAWVDEMRNLPTTVISSTLRAPLDWPDASVESGDAVEVVARLKETSDVPLLSHGSLTLNHALLRAGLVDRVRVTVFPVIASRTGVEPVFGDTDDLDLELLDSRVLDGRTLELTYRPTLH